MPRNESGQYVKPPGTTAVPNTTIASAPYNALQDDMADALTESLPRTGVAPMLADLPMNGNKITGLADGADSGDAVNFGQLDQGLDAKLNVDASNVGDATAQEAFRSAISAPLRGHKFGLILSNNTTDATNDIDLAAGECASQQSTPILMAHPGATGLQLDVAYGTGSGARFDASISDGWWHAFVISNGSSVEFGLSKSLDPTGQENYPSGFTHYRRIGSIWRTSGVIKPFYQRDKLFLWVSPPLDLDVTSTPTTATNKALSVPEGVSVSAKLLVSLLIATAGNSVRVFSPYVADEVATQKNATVESYLNTGGDVNEIDVLTNTTREILYRGNSALTLSYFAIKTLGWYDYMGTDT